MEKDGGGGVKTHGDKEHNRNGTDGYNIGGGTIGEGVPLRVFHIKEGGGQEYG